MYILNEWNNTLILVFLICLQYTHTHSRHSFSSRDSSHTVGAAAAALSDSTRATGSDPHYCHCYSYTDPTIPASCVSSPHCCLSHRLEQNTQAALLADELRQIWICSMISQKCFLVSPHLNPVS